MRTPRQRAVQALLELRDETTDPIVSQEIWNLSRQNVSQLTIVITANIIRRLIRANNRC